MAPLAELPPLALGVVQPAGDLASQLREVDHGVDHQLRRQPQQIDVGLVQAALLVDERRSLGLVVDRRDLVGDTSFGYGDFDDGTVVTVESGSGEVLGVGILDGSPVGYRCVYSADFSADRSGDGIYVVTAGNGNRGELTYTDSDIEDGVLTVSANLG